MNIISARTLDEALRALKPATEKTRILAGGTDLMVEFEAGRTYPDLVVDIWKLDELRAIREENGGVRIGALASCTELLRSPIVGARADILVDAAREVGAVQIRNRATIGGNLGTASPAADLNPVLFALGASVRLTSTRGPRELPVGSFITGYRSNAKRVDELIESIFIPARDRSEKRAFRKVGTRRAQSIAKVVIALSAIVEKGRVRTITAAAGSVADRTLLLPSLEKHLVGRTPDIAMIERAARASARDDCSPRTDVRSTDVYRRNVFHRIVARALSEMLLKR